MTTVPFIGRLDVTLATLLVVERYGTIADEPLTEEEVLDEVLAVVDLLDVPPEQLEELDTFDHAVADSLDRLVEAGWLARTGTGDDAQFSSVEMSVAALGWIRDRLSQNPVHLHDYNELHGAITEGVVEDGEDDAEMEDDVPVATSGASD